MGRSRLILSVLCLLTVLLVILFATGSGPFVIDLSVREKIVVHKWYPKYQPYTPSKLSFYDAGNWEAGSPSVAVDEEDKKLDSVDHLNYQKEVHYVQQGNSDTSSSFENDSWKHLEAPELKLKVCYFGEDLPDALQPCKREKLRPRLLPYSTSVIETPVLPIWPQLYPEISNGHVATVVQSNSIFMNGLYNGADVQSHRARIPSTAAVFVNVAYPDQNVTGMFTLDMGRGVFNETYTGSGFTVGVRRYAHRQLTRLLVTEVIVNRTTSTSPITLSFNVAMGPSSSDIDFKEEKPGVLVGRTKEAEYPEVAGTIPVTVVHSLVPPMLTFAPTVDGSVVFLTSVSPYTEDALSQFNEGKNRFYQGTLFSSHVDEWEALWQRGRIDMAGNDTMAICTTATMYYLLSALPLKKDLVWPFVGMSPGGLAHGSAGKDYNGHVFWDQDTWMFPPIALLHMDLGRMLVDSRMRTLGKAILHAENSGYKGARYPWESGYTGLPVSPSEGTSLYELHVTGDVSFMMRQYLQLTNDTDFLASDGGYEALAAMADFWVSRSVYNLTSKMFEILDVMGPDEYHSQVNNSVYTNMIAAQSMNTALYAASLTGQTPSFEWKNITTNMYIPFDMHKMYHPEFDGYSNDTIVKQADVILLGFPFKWAMTHDVQLNDLTYYASVTPGGPAMTWSIFAVNWLRIGERTTADRDFYRGTWNIQNPFKVWSEDADGGGAYNFHTGMGGYLQSLLYGYLGVDLSEHSLRFNPQLPPSLTTMAVRGMDYLGGSLDVAYDASQMNVTLTKAARLPLSLVLQSRSQPIILKVGTAVQAQLQWAVIHPVS